MRLTRWIAYNFLAEMLGVIVLLAWIGVVLEFYGSSQTLSERIVLWFLLSLAVAPAGFVFGGVQSAGALHFLPRLNARRWVKATIVAGFLWWILATGIAIIFYGDIGSVELPDVVGSFLKILITAVLGMLAGSILGVLQSSAVPYRIAIRFWWPVANAIGWGAAMPIIYFGAHFSGSASDITVRIGCWLAASGIGGFVIGAVTGVALILMQVDRDLDEEEERSASIHTTDGSIV